MASMVVCAAVNPRTQVRFPGRTFFSSSNAPTPEPQNHARFCGILFLPTDMGQIGIHTFVIVSGVEIDFIAQLVPFSI